MSELTVKEYFNIKNRMTKHCQIKCSDCPLSINRNNKCCGCNTFESECTDEAITIVEKWGKEHPMITNLQHYAEVLRKVGFKVKEEQLKNECPGPYFDDFGDEIPCPYDSCENCRKWWNEEYVPAESVEE